MSDARARLRVTGAALEAGGPTFDEEFPGGEIVGLAGLDGHGQEAFLEALAGWRPLARGGIALIREGDIIVGYKGQPIASIDDLHKRLVASEIGVPSPVMLLRQTEKLFVMVVPEELRAPARKLAR